MPSMPGIEQSFCRSAPWPRLCAKGHPSLGVGRVRTARSAARTWCWKRRQAAGTARTFPHVRRTVTDIDPAMVAAARKRLGTCANARVERADATDLPFADNTFNVVTSYLMLHHVVEWHQALTEVSRVLRPGGAFTGYDLDKARLRIRRSGRDLGAACRNRTDNLLYEVTRRAPHASTAALSPAETRLTRDTTTVSALHQQPPNCTAPRPTAAELRSLRGLSDCPTTSVTPSGHCTRIGYGAEPSKISLRSAEVARRTMTGEGSRTSRAWAAAAADACVAALNPGPARAGRPRRA
ncbi:MAG: Methyltransferase type 11 [Marmoricola sp.]|nr:Methyltransferase type 11 [Marmoricola sp.]